MDRLLNRYHMPSIWVGPRQRHPNAADDPPLVLARKSVVQHELGLDDTLSIADGGRKWKGSGGQQKDDDLLGTRSAGSSMIVRCSVAQYFVHAALLLVL
jgi:hypothetical protein